MIKYNFPAGLIQPAGSARFGMDALLLASFANQESTAHHKLKVTDIGCGAGAAGFAFCLQNGGAFTLGLDREPEMIAAARQNADLLNLGCRCRFEVHDLGTKLPQDWLGKFDLCLANPPWRDPRKGKLSPAALKRRALWLEEDTLANFCISACNLLNAEGDFFLIVSCDLKKQIEQIVKQATFSILTALAVKPFKDAAISRILLHMRKTDSKKPVGQKSLILHEKLPGGQTLWHEKALQFCPWLGKN